MIVKCGGGSSYMSLGDRLKLARESRGLSQLDVHVKTGINNKTLSRYENNGSEPDIETLKILANLYDTTVSYLIGEKEEQVVKLDEILTSKNLTWYDNELTPEQINKAKQILKVLFS